MASSTLAWSRWNWSISSTMYIPISLEYGLFLKSSSVETSWITLRAGVDAEVSIWKGAKHGWVPTDMPVYNKDAAERHWVKLVALFDSVLK